MVSSKIQGSAAKNFPARLNQSDSKLSEKQLQESREFLQNVINSMTDPVFVKDEQHCWLLLNEAFCQMIGYSHEELIGKSDYDLFPPEQAAVFWARDAQVLTTGIPDENEELLSDGQGIVRTISTKKSRFLNSSGQKFLVGIICDISDRKQNEAALRQINEQLEARVEERTHELRQVIEQLEHEMFERQQAEKQQARLAAILEATTDFVGIADGESHALYINKAGRHMLGVAEDADITSTSIADYVADSSLDLIFNQALPSAIQDGVWSGEATLRHRNGQEVLVSKVLMSHKDEHGSLEFVSAIARDISDRQRAEAVLQRQLAAIEASADGISILNQSGEFIYMNSAHAKVYGYDQPSDLVGQYWGVLYEDEELGRFQQEIMPRFAQDGQWRGEAIGKRKDGSRYPQEVSLTQVPDGLVCVVQDITERKQAEDALRHSEAQLRHQTQQLEQTLRNLQLAQAQLVQSEKMSSLGQLVAGVAHEINNPVSFIHGNIGPADQYIRDLLDLLHLYETQYPDASPIIQEKIAEIDLEFLCQDLPRLFASMKVGAERIREIVRTLRNFSRLDEAEVKAVNIHEGIDSTLMILQNRLKARPGCAAIQVVKDYGELPEIECYAGQLNQVFMNILTNAIDALDEHELKLSVASASSKITIHTEMLDPQRAVIRISDNAGGMSEAVQQRLFNPFFTTKPVGKGTGLGMSISYQIVTEKHNGSLQCFSSPGVGTTFVIEIPVGQSGS